MAHSESIKMSTVPKTIVSRWAVDLYAGAKVGGSEQLITVEVRATSKQEAINKALVIYPNHTWAEVRQLDAEAPAIATLPADLQPAQKTLKPLPIGRKSHDAARIHDVDEEGDAPDNLWSRPWTPTTREGEETTLSQIVHEAIGTGSMCWNETPAGIFDSEKASWVAGGAINAIEKFIFAQTGYTPGSQKLGRSESLNIDPHELIKEQSTDAQRWGLAFASQFDLPEKMDYSIQSWFASAIETAKDHVRNHELGENIDGEIRKAEEATKAEWDAQQEWTVCQGETAAPTLSEEDKQLAIQHAADKADIIELILSYRNHANDEQKLRQIKVVMD